MPIWNILWHSVTLKRFSGWWVCTLNTPYSARELIFPCDGPAQQVRFVYYKMTDNQSIPTPNKPKKWPKVVRLKQIWSKEALNRGVEPFANVTSGTWSHILQPAWLVEICWTQVSVTSLSRITCGFSWHQAGDLDMNKVWLIQLQLVFMQW